MDMTSSMQLRKSLAATHVFQATIGMPPVQPLAHGFRERPSADTRCIVNQTLNTPQCLWKKCLPACDHAEILHQPSDGVQRFLWDTISPSREGEFSESISVTLY